MGVVFGQLAGLSGLAAIPLMVGIYLLQRRARRVETSTLFLLDSEGHDTPRGTRIESLQGGKALWLHLLAAALLVLILTRPALVRPAVQHRVALILDTSLSMGAFAPELATFTRTRLPDFEGGAEHTEWIVIASDSRLGTLYTGTKREDAAGIITGQPPQSGQHDPDAAFLLARQLADAPQDRVLFLTDRPVTVPPGIEILSIGRRIGNVGFSGLALRQDGQELRWRTHVKSYSAGAEERTWWLESDGRRASGQTLSLKAHEVMALEGVFPAGVTRLSVRLSGDGFTADDELPIIRPVLKAIGVYIDPAAPGAALIEAILLLIDGVRLTPDFFGADLQVLGRERAESGDKPVLVLRAGLRPASVPAAPVVVARSPLVEGLRMDGLSPADVTVPELRAGDEVLVWKGERVLAHRRGTVLSVNFDVSRSNAAEIPGFVLLLRRFVEAARRELPALEQRNFELGELLDVGFEAGAHQVVLRGPEGERTVTGEALATARAPWQPGFFSLTQRSSLLLAGAAHFADVSEADFSAAEPLDGVSRAPGTQSRGVRLDERWYPLWLLLFLAVIAWRWSLERRPAL